MSSKRLIAVLGATGAQGGAVVRYLSTQPEYEVRGLTRNPDGKAAKELAQLPNVSMVKAHFNDPMSLRKAFEGVEAVYALTNFYDAENQSNKVKEAQQGMMIADVAKETGVNFLIWSTVPSAFLRTKGKFEAPRLVENKFYVSAYLKQIKMPHVDMYLGFYYENWANFHQLSVDSEGAIELVQPVMKPEQKLGMIWVERDLGPTVDTILKTYRTRPDLLGDAVYCVGGFHSTADVAREIQKQTDKQTRVVTAPTSGLEDLDIMFGYYNQYSLYNEFPIPTEEAQQLGIRFHTMEDFVREGAVPHIKKLVQSKLME
ncbi:hypothetical protein LTR20_009731 [Exophiala xenobiotica]|nr:hypothetical protein LTS13_003960 [Exophiala xenobiotica]KAK5391645.1 hypothetical protein LTR79_010945 [Exophiala xenobiotica]KAK5411668.1 hypothetical protein LTR90_008042 [Exophiala xenobiotica]KAK5455345.1 hypothetical protein LTR20_009731 [Exophiala xenobiotica]KAK5483684.1 hypothetical protein LTR26_006117 [Exophiala xenobiotica]